MHSSTVADLGGGAPKFFRFHAVFGKIWQNHMLAPPPGELAPTPPWENPGSAAAVACLPTAGWQYLSGADHPPPCRLPSMQTPSKGRPLPSTGRHPPPPPPPPRGQTNTWISILRYVLYILHRDREPLFLLCPPRPLSRSVRVCMVVMGVLKLTVGMTLREF